MTSADRQLASSPLHSIACYRVGDRQRQHPLTRSSGLWICSLDHPESRNLKAGLFEPGSVPEPTTENWLKNKEPWEKLQDNTKKYDENFT